MERGGSCSFHMYIVYVVGRLRARARVRRWRGNNIKKTLQRGGCTHTHTCARVTPSPHTPTHTHIVAHEVAAAADAATSVLTLQYLGCALVRLADSLVVRVGLGVDSINLLILRADFVTHVDGHVL